MTKVIQERAILTNQLGSIRLRVVKVYKDKTWVFDLTNPAALPYDESTDELNGLYQSGAYIDFVATTERKVSKKMRNRARKVYKLMKPAFDVTEELLTGEGRGKWQRELEKSHPTLTRKTFIRYVRQWFAGGCVPVNLLPNWDTDAHGSAIDIERAKNLPYATAKKEVLTYVESIVIDPRWYEDQSREIEKQLKGRGRPRKNTRDRTTFFRISDAALRVFIKFYKWKLEKRGRTLEQARTEMIHEVFSYQDPTGRIIAMDIAVIPSQEIFDHWWKQVYSYDKRRRSLKGDRHVDLNEREKQGDEMSKSPHAGAMAGLDATIWNVYLRSRFPDRSIVGPAIVFRLRCLRSGMLLGLYVGLENASWLGAAAAVANCLEDKVEFCRKYGIDISPEDWPVHGLPGAIIADRGETDNHGPERFIDATGVQVTNTPSHRPDIRPGSESDFQTLQVKMNGMTPGVLVDRWSERQGDDWKIETVMDIDQFTRLLIRYELDKMKTPRKDLMLPSKMIAGSVDGSPLSVWNWSVANEGGGLRHFHLREVQQSLMPRMKGSVRAEGVYFRGIVYQCPALSSSNAFMKARILGRESHEIAFDPRLVDTVYVVEDKDDSIYLPCFINVNHKAQRDFVGKSFTEVDKLLDLKQQNSESNPQVHLQRAIDHRSEVREILQQAEQQTRSAIPKEMTKATQKKNISVNRERERNVHSPTQAFTANVAPPVERDSTVIPLDSRRNNPRPRKGQSREFLDLLNAFQPSSGKKDA